MAVDWTPHRFSGGVLALDVANTIVHRDKPDSRFDRFADPDEIARFAEAASAQRAAEIGGGTLRVSGGRDGGRVVIALRETTDALFREGASSGELSPNLLAPFLRSVADALSSSEAGLSHGAQTPTLTLPTRGREASTPRFLRQNGVRSGGLFPPCGEGKGGGAAPHAMALPSKGERPVSPLRFETALGLSALSLLPPEMHRRIRICPNCAWLFLDRSRNRSRTWCDMTVCGNRSKARRHYRKRKTEEAADG